MSTGALTLASLRLRNRTALIVLDRCRALVVVTIFEEAHSSCSSPIWAFRACYASTQVKATAPVKVTGRQVGPKLFPLCSPVHMSFTSIHQNAHDHQPYQFPTSMISFLIYHLSYFIASSIRWSKTLVPSGHLPHLSHAVSNIGLSLPQLFTDVYRNFLVSDEAQYHQS